MSILDRASLEQSPLADLHAIASELAIDSYRRLRRAELIDAILDRQAGGEAGADPADEAEAEPESDEGKAPRRRRGRRGGRGRGSARAEDDEAPDDERETHEHDAEAREEGMAEIERELERAAPDTVEGVVEVLPNGSAFVRVNPPDPSDDDVYVSTAQVKRCDLISGDRVSGPRRPPRRSERFAALVRVDTVNGQPAADRAGAPKFDELPAAFPNERFELLSEDPTIAAIAGLTPIGRGSRVTIAGPARAGKTETLRRLAVELAGDQSLQLRLALVGVRPEEVPEWEAGPVAPAAVAALGASPDAQGQAIENVVEQGRRSAARGADAVVLIDTLDELHPHAARKALAAARNISGGGSLTVIATAKQPFGGETTVIALDPMHSGAGREPALDLAASWTMRAELLGGEGGFQVIGRPGGDGPGGD